MKFAFHWIADCHYFANEKLHMGSKSLVINVCENKWKATGEQIIGADDCSWIKA